MARLICLSADEHWGVELGDFTTLGRHPHNAVPISDEEVSKLHAQIHRLPDGSFLLRDLDSRNGTFVRGVRTRKVRLEDGDLIRVGQARFLFVQAGRAPPPLRQGSSVPAPSGSGVPSRPEDAEARGAGPPPATPGSKAWLGDGPMESGLADPEDLRRENERLRSELELVQKIGAELDLRVILEKILDHALRLSGAGRGTILLSDLEGDPVPRSSRARGEREAKDLNLSPEVLEEVRSRGTGVITPAPASEVEPESSPDEGPRTLTCMTVPFIHRGEFLGVMHLASAAGSIGFTGEDLELANGMANWAALAIRSAHQARRIERQTHVRGQLSRLVPPSVVEKVLRGEIDLDPGGRMKEITVLHSDIQGFTAVTQREAPEEVVRSLNEFLEVLVEVLFHHGGTLDRFVGDQIIGLFGAPGDLDDGPARAVQCAVEMRQVLNEVSRYREDHGLSHLGLGVGVATGPAIVGAIGSTWALQYTAIGVPVEEASVLAEKAATDEILLSESTFRRVQDRFMAEEVPAEWVGQWDGGIRAYRVLVR